MTPEATDTTRPKDEPITRADIEAKLRQITGTVGEGAEQAKGTAIAVGVVVVGVVIVAAYLIGRRRGRKTRTWVEIRRI